VTLHHATRAPSDPVVLTGGKNGGTRSGTDRNTRGNSGIPENVSDARRATRSLDFLGTRRDLGYRLGPLRGCRPQGRGGSNPPFRTTQITEYQDDRAVGRHGTSPSGWRPCATTCTGAPPPKSVSSEEPPARRREGLVRVQRRPSCVRAPHEFGPLDPTDLRGLRLAGIGRSTYDVRW
jgi:hypothetical protein